MIPVQTASGDSTQFQPMQFLLYILHCHVGRPTLVNRSMLTANRSRPLKPEALYTESAFRREVAGGEGV